MVRCVVVFDFVVCFCPFPVVNWFVFDFVVCGIWSTPICIQLVVPYSWSRIGFCDGTECVVFFFVAALFSFCCLFLCALNVTVWMLWSLFLKFEGNMDGVETCSGGMGGEEMMIRVGL